MGQRAGQSCALLLSRVMGKTRCKEEGIFLALLDNLTCPKVGIIQ